MRITSLALLFLSVLVATPARADLRITRDHGGYVEEYKPSTSDATAGARI